VLAEQQLARDEEQRLGRPGSAVDAAEEEDDVPSGGTRLLLHDARICEHDRRRHFRIDL
jgi:hypothetical protein